MHHIEAARAEDDASAGGAGFPLRVPDGWTAALVVGGVHAAAAAAAFDPTPQSGGDNAAYRALAQSLMGGQGYVRLWEPALAPETLYPPLFPLLLSLPMRVGLDRWAALNAFMIPMSVALVVGAYLLLRRMVPGRLALGAGLALALSPGLLSLSHQVLSDLPFAALCVAVLWALHVATLRDGRDARGALAVVVAGTVLAYLTRTAALPLALAAGAWLLHTRRLGALALLGATLAPVAFLWSRRGSLPGAPQYGQFLFNVDPYLPTSGRMDGAAWVARITRNAWKYATEHLPTLLFGSDYGLPVLAGWIVLGLAIAGYVLRLKRPTACALFLPLYIGMLLVWPATWSTERFLLPIVPLLLAYAVTAALALRPRVPALYLLAAAGVMAAVMLHADVLRFQHAAACRAGAAAGDDTMCMDEDWRPYFSVARGLAGRLPAGSVILSRKPTLMFSESGYRSATYPFSAVQDTLLKAAGAVGARYLVADALQLSQLFVVPVLDAHPDRFCVHEALSDPTVLLVRIEPAGAGAPPPPKDGVVRICDAVAGEQVGKRAPSPPLPLRGER